MDVSKLIYIVVLCRFPISCVSVSIKDNSKFIFYIHPILLQYYFCELSEEMSSKMSGKTRKETGQFFWAVRWAK
jgi:hypothetical protein